jgi:hypothetical protein
VNGTTYEATHYAETSLCQKKKSRERKTDRQTDWRIDFLATFPGCRMTLIPWQLLRTLARGNEEHSQASILRPRFEPKTVHTLNHTATASGSNKIPGCKILL